LRYWTDPFTNGQGFFVDSIAVGGQTIGTAETAGEGWTFDTRSTGPNSDDPLPSFTRQRETVEGALFDHFYIAEYRQHDGYDESLRTAYNFGFVGATPNRPDWVETHPYMEGLLVWYWDTQYSDNNVGDHPGHGELLPVDAHPQFNHWPSGQLMRNRILSYDSTFGLKATTALTLHNAGVEGTVPSRPAVRMFDDTMQWWFPSDEHTVAGVHPGRYQPAWYSVDVPKTGSTIRVNGFGKMGDQINLTVN
jgi:immune inhibitor A